ncbi:MAG: molybdopterin molybdotransferase MoeA [Deltaproteobacteria bacterium]|nr:molybdopterin molybdotransferase MoeA [Deltaproteobacteria bacterium]MCL4873724.1 molybdopterin molybdotransferase MoeA [bacterium]
MISVKEALDTILKEIRPLGIESVPVERALGRVLGEDVKARGGNPPWDNSAMDGYALRAADTSGASPEKPVRLKVLYDLPAGRTPGEPVAGGSAVRIMTGAPVPQGADSVVMVERTEPGDGFVLVKAQARPGDNIRRQGEDFKAGETVIERGALIRPSEVSMLATVGVPFIFVHKRPRVAVISTGDELSDIFEAPGFGKITNSNGYALSALVKSAGAVPIQLGIARDTRESLRERLEAAMSADCIVSSGGVSVGDYDFVKDVLKEMGSSMIFWKVAMKPGKPLAFGVIGGKPAFGLPGNPVSSMVAFEQFVRPSLLKMAGRKDLFRRAIEARITKDLKIKPGRMNFIRAELSLEDNAFTATPLDGQGSGMISTMVRANSFIIVPEGSAGFRAGDTVKVQPFDETVLGSAAPAF